jgi:hypothetical protein
VPLLLLWLLLAHDGRYHWDEPMYLYIPAYFDTARILDPSVQPMYGFYSSRILHLLFTRLVFSMTGPGPLGIALVAGTYTALLLATIGLGVAIVRRLVGWRREMLFGVALASMAPIVLWLGFKTLPEAPALFAVVLAIWAYLRSLERPRLGAALPWLLLAGAMLAVTALTRNALALAFATFVVTLLAFRGFRFPVARVVGWAAVVGAASLVIFAALLRLTGLELGDYLRVLGLVMGEPGPLAVRLYVGVMEPGPLLLAVPLALLYRPRRDALFFLVWFTLATGIVFVLLRNIETRYLLLNLPPLLALVCLATAAVADRLRPRPRCALAVTALALAAAAGAVAQPFMEHEVMSRDVDRVIRTLDARYGGPHGYTILTPWHHTDFHYLRVTYPDHLVRSVGRDESHEPTDLVTDVERRHYGGELLADADGLAGQRRPWLYYGFETNFTLANVRVLAARLPAGPIRAWTIRVVRRMTQHNQFARSWMWGDPRYRFTTVLRIGHYRVDEVTPVEPIPRARSFRRPDAGTGETGVMRGGQWLERAELERRLAALEGKAYYPWPRLGHSARNFLGDAVRAGSQLDTTSAGVTDLVAITSAPV